MPMDESLIPGAKNAVQVCLGIKESDRVVVFTDQSTAQIGEVLVDAVREQGAEVKLRLLEEIGPRPLLEVPESLWDFLDEFKPTASYYAATSQPNEIRFRIPLIETLNQKYKVRHGHMIGITPEVMRTGMRADYSKVAARTHAVHALVKDAKTIRITNPTGTDLTGTFDSQALKWVIWDGLYTKPGVWGNLPEGEVFTSPVDVNGTITASVMGDFFSEKYGLLSEPLRLEVRDGFLTRCEHPNQEMATEFWDYLDGVENGRRIGEFAIGTNESLTKLIGNLLQDEKFPGAHVAFGNPYANYTGAKWDSPVHVDVVMQNTSIWVDGKQIMDDGRFLE